MSKPKSPMIRTNIHIDRELWMKFRMICLSKSMSATQCLSSMIKGYVKKNKI